MSVINQIQCQDSIKNTGVCDCYFDPKNFIGCIIAPLSTLFGSLDFDTALATLNAKISAVKSDRIYPFFGWVGIADNSEDATRQTFGFGTQETVREGKYVLTAEFRKGGLNLNNALRSFNGKQSKYGVFFVDAENTLIGTTTPGQGVGIKPIPLDDLYTYPFKVNDGSKVSQYRTMFTFDPVYVNENIAFVKLDPTVVLLKELEGLTDVTISKLSATSTTVVVKLNTSCGEDLYDTYADELSDVDAFVLANATSGGVITLTSVVKNDTLKAWTITIPTASNPNYPAAAGVYTVKLVNPSDLSLNLGVTGFENVNTLSVTRPA